MTPEYNLQIVIRVSSQNASQYYTITEKWQVSAENLERKTGFTFEASASCSETMTSIQETDQSLKELKDKRMTSQVQVFILYENFQLTFQLN
jgi:hypothetical protein